MAYKSILKKALILSLLVIPSLQVKAQYLENIYDYIENTSVFEEGQEAAEYDVTPYVKSGKNTIAVCVVKYSDGYYLEGQDYWRLAGIFDDVTLYATPKTRLFDWFVTTDLDEQYKDAQLNLKVDVKSYEQAAKTHKVRATLTSQDGVKIAQMLSEEFTINGLGKKSFDFSSHISNPAKWTAETPTLYNLTLELLSDSGLPSNR